MVDAVLYEIRTAKKPHYVYLLQWPDGRPFYVGMGSVYPRETGNRQRVFAHLAAAICGERSHKASIIRKIIRDGGSVEHRIDSWHDDPSSAKAREMDLIAFYGRADLGTGYLTNRTDGGDGFRTPSPAERSRRAARARRQLLADPIKHRAMIEASSVTWRKPEMKLRLKAQALAAHADPAIKLRHAEAVRKAQGKPEYRAARSALSRKMWAALSAEERRSNLPWGQSLEIEAKRIANLTKAINRPEYLANKSAETSSYWSDSDHRRNRIEAMRAAQQRPSVLEAKKKATAEAWANASSERRATRIEKAVAARHRWHWEYQGASFRTRSELMAFIGTRSANGLDIMIRKGLVMKVYDR